MKATSIPKWMRKLTAAQRRHVRETTQRGTLAEIRSNVARSPGACFECADILRRIAS